LVNYRKLKEDWKKSGEIPEWYSSNALQFFMETYSYEGESVKSRDETTNKWLAKFAPKVYPEWWDEDPYFKGLTYEEAFNKLDWDGFTAKSTPLKANGGLPQRGLTVSCCGQDFQNSVASKAFARGELEVLIKNSHGCSLTISDWLAEGVVYDADGNRSHGIAPIIDDLQSATEAINQGIRRGQTLLGVNARHGDFWTVAKMLFDQSDVLNIAWLLDDEFVSLLESGDEETIKRWNKILYIRMSKGKGYFTKIDTMNRNKAQIFKDLDLRVKGSNLCNEVNLPVNEEYSFTCVIINANLSMYRQFPEHLWHVLHIMQDCNVSGYIDEIKKKTGYNALFLSKVLKFTEDFRAVGTGVCGFHSLLMQEGIVFGSIESFHLNRKIFKKMREDLEDCSRWLASVMGEPPAMKGTGLRNATLIMLPPTKSSTELARNTPTESINPTTALVKVKETVGGDIFRIEPVLLKLLKEKGKYTDEIISSIARNKGSVQHLDFLSEEEKAVFRIAFEIPMESHLDLCAHRQQFIDQQQSINLYLASHDSEEYIAEIHKKALLDEGINGLYYCYSSRGGDYERAGCIVCQ
jgi:ribonucleoside-diphosphate reductase alpha chain